MLALRAILLQSSSLHVALAAVRCWISFVVTAVSRYRTPCSRVNSCCT